LEAATSRLEDLAVANTNDFREARAAQRSSASLSKEPSPQFNTGVFAPDAGPSVAEEFIVEEEKSPVILDYEKLVKDFVDPWAAKSEKVGEVVGEQVFHLYI
jgi:Adenylate cyclase associated (CAP) N terminal